MIHLFVSLLVVSCCSSFVRSFTFKVEGQPSQCDPISFSWTGGQPPFRLIAVVPGGTNLNMSIPDSNFKDDKGTFSIDSLPLGRGNQTFFSMSDSTGPVSGGTSSLMTVGANTSGRSCNSTTPNPDFTFAADSALTQCGRFPFSFYDGAIKPLTIFAHIPNGHDSFVLPFAPDDNSNFAWKANITAQTEVAFSMIDSRGRTGGTDIMRRVAPSSDSSCILSSGGGNSPGAGTGTPGNNNNDDDRGGQKLLSVGAIAGIAVGGAVIACILIGIIWCLIRRRSKSKRVRPLDLSEDFNSRNPQTSQTNLPNEYAPVPYPAPAVFVAPGANASSASFHPEHLGQHTPTTSLSPATSPPQSQYYDGPSSSSGQATGSSSRRFIVHQDIEEGDTPIDLPPQYSDRRAPIPGLAETSPPPSLGGRTKKG